MDDKQATLAIVAGAPRSPASILPAPTDPSMPYTTGHVRDLRDRWSTGWPRHRHRLLHHGREQDVLPVTPVMAPGPYMGGCGHLPCSYLVRPYRRPGRHRSHYATTLTELIQGDDGHGDRASRLNREGRQRPHGQCQGRLHGTPGGFGNQPRHDACRALPSPTPKRQVGVLHAARPARASQMAVGAGAAARVHGPRAGRLQLHDAPTPPASRFELAFLHQTFAPGILVNNDGDAVRPGHAG